MGAALVPPVDKMRSSFYLFEDGLGAGGENLIHALPVTHHLTGCNVRNKCQNYIPPPIIHPTPEQRRIVGNLQLHMQAFSIPQINDPHTSHDWTMFTWYVLKE